VARFVYDFCRNIPVDLQFRIDDLSAGRSVGVIWCVTPTLADASLHQL
jgi:hypothetical protein